MSTSPLFKTLIRYSNIPRNIGIALPFWKLEGSRPSRSRPAPPVVFVFNYTPTIRHNANAQSSGGSSPSDLFSATHIRYSTFNNRSRSSLSRDTGWSQTGKSLRSIPYWVSVFSTTPSSFEGSKQSVTPWEINIPAPSRFKTFLRAIHSHVPRNILSVTSSAK